MLNQIDIYTYKTDTSKLWSDLSVKIHGYIMSKIDTAFAAELHEGGVMPFSNFTIETNEYYITRISTLNEKTKIITDIFHRGDKIRIFGTDSNLTIADVHRIPEVTLDKLVKLMTANKYKLSWLTPSMYKTNGELTFIPTLPAYFESVRLKLEKFENIVISRDELYSAFDEVKVLQYQVKSVDYISGNKKTSGMVGSFEIKLPNSGPNANLLRTLLAYATYSGVGGQTTQGMGGFIIERINNSKKLK